MSNLGEWAAKLPPSWEVKPLKAVATYMVSNVDKVPAENELPVRLCNYTDVYKNEFITPTMNLMQTTATAQEIAKFRLHEGDVVITKDSESWDDIAIPSLVLEEADDLLCGYHLAILRARKGAMHGHFLFRCLQAKAIRVQLELVSMGVTRFGLPKEEIGKLLLPVPSLAEQKRIAKYLTAETAQIDALVSEKQNLLLLLAQKRMALIHDAVTRGVYSSVRLRPTDVGWIGSIPHDWNIRRCANLFTEIDERNEPELPLLNVSLNTGVTLRTFSEDRIESVAEDFASYKVARKDDLVANRMRFWQGAVGIAPVDGLTSPDYMIARIGPELLPAYVELLFRTPQFSSEVKRYSHGMVDDRLRLYWDEFKTIRIPVPPIAEQKRIVEAVERETKRIAEVEGTLTQSIALLKERRGALITAAITGQIEPVTVTA